MAHGGQGLRTGRGGGGIGRRSTVHHCSAPPQGVASVHTSDVVGNQLEGIGALAAGGVHLPPVVEAMEVDPPFGDAVAVLVVDAVEVGELRLGERIADVEEVVAVEEVDVVLGVGALVVEAVVGEEQSAEAVDVARVVERAEDGIRIRTAAVGEGRIVELAIDGGERRDDVVHPAFDGLDGAALVPDAEFVDEAIVEVTGEGGDAGADDRLGLGEGGAEADAVDEEAE